MKYKALLFGFIAIFCFDYNALAYFNLKPGGTEDEHKLMKRDDSLGSIPKFVEEVNLIRRVRALRFNVPDMHELLWDDYLVKILDNLDWAQSWPEARKSWRYGAVNDYIYISKLYKEIDGWVSTDANKRKKHLDEIKASTTKELEFVNPLQKFIGCGVKPEGSGKIGVCLLGPEGAYTFFDVEGKDSNVLASKCSKGYKHVDGLCTPEDKSKQSYLGSPLTFVEDLNDIRRHYAKEYNVPDMHELVFNDDLHTILKNLDWMKGFPEAGKTWRVAKPFTFQSPAADIEWAVNDFIGKDEAGRKDIIDKLSRVNLEMVHPKQTLIACDGKWNDKKTEYMARCLIGTEGYGLMFDVDGKDTNVLGSKCSENYQNQDGLCTPIDKSKLSYLGSPENFVTELNTMRREYAKQYNVPDMHELIWSDDLLKILNSLDGSLSWKEARITWRFAKVLSFRITDIKMEEELKAYLAMDDGAKQKHSEHSANSLELINPLQKFIACRREANTEVFGLCVVGVEGRQFTLFDVDGKDSNVLGSKCSEGYKNEDGLCTPEDKSKESYIGTPERFVEHINEQRRYYAKKYKVPDMHELIWSEELSQILAPLNWQNSWPAAWKTWRYAKVESFRTSLAADLERDVAYFQNKDEAGRAEFKTRKSANALEFLNPLQQFIACKAEWGPGNKELFGVCLVGVEGPTCTIFDVDDKSRKYEANKCAKGYKLEDQMCTPIDKSKVSYLGNPEDFLHDVNQLRRRYATEYNVPDMHELVWSPDLVKILENLDWSKNWPEARITWRYAKVASFRLSKTSVEKDINDFLAKDQAARKLFLDGVKSTADSLELVNPLQKVMACGVKWNDGKTEVFGVCLFGTEGPSFTMFDVDNKDPNALGSKCSPGYRNSYGLCSPISKPKVSYVGNPIDFTRGINQMRRHYAKQYNVPDMHELIWNEDLVGILERLDWSKSWPDARITWRYAKVASFQLSKTSVEKDINDFLAKNQASRKTYLDGIRSTADSLELVNPLQKFIGCGVKWNDAKTEAFGVCLIGPEGPAFTMFNMDGKDPNMLGSKCSKRYTSNDGLCVADDKSKEHLLGSTEEFLEEVNQLRRHYAKEYNTPNMYELVWSEELVSMLDPVVASRKPWTEPVLYWLNDFRRLTALVQDDLKSFLEKDESGRKEFASKHLRSLTLLDPFQKFIGCKPKRFDGFISLDAVCLIGPEKPSTMLDVDSKSKDVLGSKCDEGYNHTDGLCTPIDRSKVSYLGSPREYVQKVNGMRRHYAKEYNVPDMHELVWSEELVKVLDGLKWEGSWPEARQTWRYTRLFTFHSPVKFLEVEMNSFLGKDEATRQVSITEASGLTAFELELLNPLQTSIGCAAKKNKQNTDFFGVCLVGPEGPKFTMFDVNGKSNNNVLGSKCSDPYQNIDGMCSIPIPSTLSPSTTSEPVPTTPEPMPVWTPQPKEPEAQEQQQPLNQDVIVVEESELSSSPSTHFVITIALFVFLYLV